MPTGVGKGPAPGVAANGVGAAPQGVGGELNAAVLRSETIRLIHRHEEGAKVPIEYGNKNQIGKYRGPEGSANGDHLNKEVRAIPIRRNAKEFEYVSVKV